MNLLVLFSSLINPIPLDKFKPSGTSKDPKMHSGGKGKRSIFNSVFKRGKGTVRNTDYRASDINISQDQIIKIMDKVKTHEITQEDALIQIQK